ncbi:uncharacterized protein LOC134219693 [Armigeres subalbatus]|uniref:uncharacterized protein LOC134219693 n=1 Tax=Armigeres subalbatus TaxID=124917 RepID=UPI002ED005E4
MHFFLLLIVFLSGFSEKSITAIEVHENVNENGTDPESGAESPLKTTLPNSSVQNGSQLAINEPGKSVVMTTSAVDYSSNSSGSQQQQVNDNNHQQHHQHSSSYRDTPLQVTPTTTVSTTVSVSSTGPSTALSSATSSSGSAFKEDSVLKDIVGANLSQQQLSAYKKRQLYSSAFHLTKNATLGRSFGKNPNRQSQSAKEFVPSQELTHLYQRFEDHRPFLPSPPIDATYPSSVIDNDSKWFGANHINIPESFQAPEIKHHLPPKLEHHKNGKYLWLPNGQTHHNGASFDSPFSRNKSRLATPPKGKWKWVPEGEEGSDPQLQSETPIENGKAPDLESKIISSGHHYFRFPPPRGHPYSFDAGQSPFSSDETGSGGFGSPGSGGGSSSSSSTTTDPLMYFFGPSPTAVVDGSSSSKLKTGVTGDSDALKGVSPWKKIIHVLSAAIPIGLIISALTPQVVYINPNMTQNPVQMQTPTPIGATGSSSNFANPSRQRSEDQTGPFGTAPANPLIGFLNALSANQSRWPNFDALFGGATGSSSPIEGGGACEEKSFCEMARQGINHDADTLFKMLWKIANETPADQASQSGLEEIFRAVKDDDCSRFHCEST